MFTSQCCCCYCFFSLIFSFASVVFYSVYSVLLSIYHLNNYDKQKHSASATALAATVTFSRNFPYYLRSLCTDKDKRAYIIFIRWLCRAISYICWKYHTLCAFASKTVRSPTDYSCVPKWSISLFSHIPQSCSLSLSLTQSLSRSGVGLFIIIWPIIMC